MAAAMADPAWRSAALTAILADQAVLFGAGLWPRGGLIGRNWSRLPRAATARGQIAISFDDGPDPLVTPGVLEILDRYGAKASFFCIGRRASAAPALCAELLRRGHSVENHSHHHAPGFACHGLGGFRRELAMAQAALTAASGRAPRFFRAPFGIRSPLLDPVLQGFGLELVSWTRRGYDTRSQDPTVICHRLTRGLAAGDILLLHDGNGARTPSGIPVVWEVLPRLLDRVAALGLEPVTLPAAFG